MEMKYVVPDMAQSFGTLEFAGESEPIFERDKNNRRVLARRSYNLYSDVQKGENVVVEIPVTSPNCGRFPSIMIGVPAGTLSSLGPGTWLPFVPTEKSL